MRCVFVLCFREFVSVCRQSLSLNSSLITSDQFEYHKSLCSNFTDITYQLSDMFNEKVPTILFNRVLEIMDV